jgi:hypothetical protein
MNKTLWASILFIVVGTIFAVSSSNYHLGTLSLIGPGFFPLLVSIILIFVGILLAIKDLYGNFK